MGLSLQELLDWPTEIENLASASHAAAATHNCSAEFYRSLANASTWEGAAGATAQQAMVASAGDHEDAADRVGRAATSMDHAEREADALAADVRAILNDAAAAPAVVVNTATNQVVAPDTSYLTEEAAAQVAAKVADLQARIAAVLGRGSAIDTELAQAISSATGVPAAKAPQPDAGRPPSGHQAAPQPNSLDDALGQLAGGSGPLPAPQPRPPMDPAEAERAKAVLRQVMVNGGVPPDQIEARVNELMAKANEPLPPSYRSPEVKGPEPGFGDGCADTWFGTEQQIRNLLGQGGPGEPGVAESWGDLVKGTAEQFSGPFGPLNPAVNEVKSAWNSPNAAYYLGQKSAEGAMTAPTLMFGGEGALARAGLDEVAAGPGITSHGIPSGLVDSPGHIPDSAATHSLATDRGFPGTLGHGDQPVVSAPDGLDHHVPIGPMPPQSINEIGQWLPEINHGPGMDPFDPARAVNCGQCALAVDHRISGIDSGASAGLGTLSVPEMEAATGLRQVAATPTEIERYLIDQGAGAHAVIGVDRANGFAGHWFNAYYDGKNVYAVDGQTGQILGWPPNMDLPSAPVTHWDIGVP